MLRVNPRAKAVENAALARPEDLAVCRGCGHVGSGNGEPARNGRRRWRWGNGRRGSDGAVRVCDPCRSGLQLATLSESQPGQTVRVVCVAGGERLVGRLGDMGVYQGCQVEVLSGGGRGPMILRIGTGRLAMGRGMSEKIVVGPLTTPVQEPGKE